MNLIPPRFTHNFSSSEHFRRWDILKVTSVVVIFGGISPTQWEVGVKILKHLCVPVTKVQAHLLSTFSIELIAIVLTVNRCTELK